MKIQTKLIFMVLIVALLMVCTTIVLYTVERKKLQYFHGVEKLNIQKRMLVIQDLLGKKVDDFTENYTEWNELLDYKKMPSDTWKNQYLTDNLNTGEIDGVWIFDVSYNLIYSGLSAHVKGLEATLLDEKIVKQQLSDKHFAHFYSKTPYGIMEIRGTTIHPNGKQNSLTNPQGYFFSGRLITKAYIEELSNLTQKQISVVASDETLESEYKGSVKEDVISFSFPLMDYNGKILAAMRVHKKSLALHQLNDFLKLSILFLIISAFFFLTILIVALSKWIFKPLRQISKSLDEEDASYLSGLLDLKNEFGVLSRLITQSFSQKNNLANEVRERKKAEDSLKEKIGSLEHFQKVTVERELKMIELKNKIVELESKLGKK